MPRKKEPEQVRGYLFTHVDCPRCGCNHELEGDRSGETLKCDDCKHQFRIREVF